MANPSAKSVFEHLINNVLELDADDINALTGPIGKIRSMRDFNKKLTIDGLNTLRKEGTISMSCWQCLTDLKVYLADQPSSYKSLMAMTIDTWDDLDMSVLRLNHKLASANITTVTPTLNSNTVTHSDIDISSFLKYVHLSLLDKAHILSFYDLLLTQAIGHNIFLRPASEITRSEGVVPDGLDATCTQLTATALHSKLSATGTINMAYVDAHNLLASTTDGYEVLQLLLNQVHPLLVVKNIATVDIPKYSTYNSLFRFAREVKQYVSNHKLKSRDFTEQEITQIFLSHLDHPRYATAIKQCENAILVSPQVDDIYRVPAIAGTIDQLAPTTTTTTTTHQQRNSEIRAIQDYYEDDSSPDFADYCHTVNASGESPFCRSFRDGGGRSPFSRGGGKGRGGRYSAGFGRGGRGRGNRKHASYKGTCNSCGMANHHADSCHFLMKLQQSLTYLGINPDANHHKRTHFTRKKTYDRHRSTVRSLIDAGFIPYSLADVDTFIDVVDGDPDVFSPDIINSVDDGSEYDEE